MKIQRFKMTEIEAIPTPEVRLHDRTTSEDYYKQYSFGRTDVVLVAFRDICNMFFEVTGSCNENWFDKASFRNDYTECDDEAKAEIRRIAKAEFDKVDKAFIEANKACFEKWGVKVY